MRAITLDEAVKIINGTFAEAKRRDAYPLTAVLLDAGGRMKAAMKQDGASLLRQLESEGCVRIHVDGESFELSREEIAVSLEAREGFAAAAGVGVVVLRTALTPALVDEGRYREG